MAAHTDHERKGPWIRRIGPDEADVELSAAYQAISRGRPLDHILEIHTLHPQSLLDHYALYRTSMCRRGIRRQRLLLLSAASRGGAP